jgi:hypothetical protein
MNDPRIATQKSAHERRARRLRLLAPLPVLCLLAPAAFGVLAGGAAAQDGELPTCFYLYPNQYCVRTIPVERVAYVNQLNKTETQLATADVERWFVSINQDIHPISPAPGIIVVAATVNGSPDPQSLNVQVTAGGHTLSTNSVYQKSLCGSRPCAIVYQYEVGVLGEVWLSILEVSENNQPLVRVPVTTVKLYAPETAGLVSPGAPDVPGFLA